MLVFLDESFREHARSKYKFGVLAGIAIPEDTYHDFQHDFFYVRKPYHGHVLSESSEIKGKELLTKKTLSIRMQHGTSAHWSLAEDLLGFAKSRGIKVFGVVCFRSDLHSFVCNDEKAMDVTFRYLFERIDIYMKREFPGRVAKIVFDNRDHQTHEKNAKAITSFFVKSPLGLGYDSILRMPLFAVSQGHNYGLQLADLVTTVIALYFQGKRDFFPLWKIIKDMLYTVPQGGRIQTSLKVMRQNTKLPWNGA
jgi:hypothetical protein